VARLVQRRFLLQALVWPVLAVVPRVLGQDLAEVPLAEDQHVVQALAAKCSREPSASFRAKSTSHPNTRTMNK
jgi:hypothetical protein